MKNRNHECLEEKKQQKILIMINWVNPYPAPMSSLAGLRESNVSEHLLLLDPVLDLTH
jgi:hypothetical protein